MSEIKEPSQSILDPDLKAILEADSADDTVDRKYIYCASCSHVITSAAMKIAVNGNHSHFFTNPHGFSYQVGCFANALGCALSGSPEAADSWFMGYFWRLAACEQCHAHLGWYFARASGEDYFYGLVLDHIQEDL